MLFDIDLDTDDHGAPNVERASWSRPEPRPMRIVLFEGDVSHAPTEAICTSTNGRLSLSAGSGGDVRSRGGWAIKRECESIVRRREAETGESELPAGTAWRTTGGDLAAKAVIHCVASDPSHSSSPEVIRDCTSSALAEAAAASCRSIAMPVFATGHAAFRFAAAVEVIAQVLVETAEPIDEVFLAVLTPDRVEQARKILDRHF